MTISHKQFGFSLAAIILALGIFLTPQTSLAFCDFFFPPDRTFTPADDMQAFVAWDDGIEHIVVQPGFTTDAEDFAFVLALPNRPTLAEAPGRIFKDLEDLTNPFLPTPMPLGAMMDDVSFAEAEEKVILVERKIVGDYDVSILTATDSVELLEWLEAEDYQFTDNDTETFDYYIDRGGYYFAALKVNNSFDQPADDEENEAPFSVAPDFPQPAQLSPIEFTFASSAAVLPTRILAGDGDTMSLTLYTLGDVPLYIPGVNVQYSQQLRDSQFPSVDFFKEPTSAEQVWWQYYDIDQQWLVRLDLELDPKEIVNDLVLTNGETNMNISSGGTSVVHPELFVDGVGIVAGNAATFTPRGNSYDSLYSDRLLQRGVRGDDVRALQQILNDTQNESLTADGIWGTKTDAAVRRFQTTYSLQIDGIVGPQTKGFMQRL
jgi:hypothetical protein